MDPQRLAGCRIDRRGLIEGCREVEHAVNHQRCSLQVSDADSGLGLSQRIEIESTIDRLPSPRDLEVVEVGLVDLIERGVLRAPEVAAVRAPLPICRAVLRSHVMRPARDPAREREPRNLFPYQWMPPRSCKNSTSNLLTSAACSCCTQCPAPSSRCTPRISVQALRSIASTAPGR